MHRGVPRRGYINAASQFYACRVVYVVFAEVLDGMRGEEMGGGIFALRRPRPYSRHCGVYCRRPSFTPARASTGTANGRITTRRAASLRPSGIGRIGFKPPYSKRGTAAKAPSIFIGIGSIGGPSSSCGQKAFNHAIPFLEDRSDAACRVVYVDLHPGIPFLPIGELGYRILGRGGAERSECPP